MGYYHLERLIPFIYFLQNNKFFSFIKENVITIFTHFPTNLSDIFRINYLLFLIQIMLTLKRIITIIIQ